MQVPKPHIRRHANAGGWSCRSELVWPQHGATLEEAWCKWADEYLKARAALNALEAPPAPVHPRSIWTRLRDALRSHA